MLATVIHSYWPYWDNNPYLDYFTDHKCIFDGINKYIIVNPGITELSIRDDIYSDWKEWSIVDRNTGYLNAIRATGGDPIDVDNGEYSGDIYFLVNGWKLLVDLSKVKITGVLYSDDYVTPYYDYDLNSVYAAKVSSVVNTYTITKTVGTNVPQEDIDAIAAKVWDTILSDHIQAGSTGDKLNTISDVPAPTSEEIANAVWEEPTTNHTTIGSFGKFIQSKLLTVSKFLGLK